MRLASGRCGVCFIARTASDFPQAMSPARANSGFLAAFGMTTRKQPQALRLRPSGFAQDDTTLEGVQGWAGFVKILVLCRSRSRRVLFVVKSSS